ncbi:MAG: major capsid protein [Symbiobacteriaceae bacterium]
MANELLMQQLHPRTILYYARDFGTINDGTLADAWQLVRELFPVRNVVDLKYDYWVGQHKRPVMAKFNAYDAEASVASRLPIGPHVKGELPKIARKVRLGEEERLLLLRINQNAALPSDVQQYIQRIYDDVTDMRDAVLARIVKLCLDAVSTIGTITVNEGGVIMEVDFLIPSGHTEVLATPWTSPDANPYEDIRRWVQVMEDTQGFTPTRALTSTRVVRALLANPNTRELILGGAYAGQVKRVPTLQEFNDWAQAFGFPQIGVLDAQIWVEDEAGNRTLTRLFPEDKFVLLPPEPLGELLFGPTAEALGMVEAGELGAEEAPGIWAGTYRETDPPVQWTKAAAVAFPTFPGADRIFIADVL